jgi:hypothetical protein
VALSEVLSQNLCREIQNRQENYQSGKAVQTSGLETGISRGDSGICELCVTHVRWLEGGFGKGLLLTR